MKKLVFQTSVVCFAAIVLIQCSINNKRNLVSAPKWEGYVILDVKLYKDVDSNGFALNTMPENERPFFPVHRKIFLLEHQMIDINQNLNFNNGIYAKTDTLSYGFYDLQTQKFASFQTLLQDAKILKKGRMSDPEGSFSNTPEYDPWSEIPDSIWMAKDTFLNKHNGSIISSLSTYGADATDAALAKKIKFWANNDLKAFPLQLSYILSKKMNASFIYKMQQPAPDDSFILVTSLIYEPATLPDSLKRIFKNWSQKVNDSKAGNH